MADELIEDGPSLLTTRPRFAPIPADLLHDLRVSHGAVRLWGVLDRVAARESLFPGQGWLATALDVNESTVRRWTGELVEAGWISSRRRGQGRTNVYTLHDRPISGLDPAPVAGLDPAPAQDLDPAPVADYREGDYREEDQREKDPPVPERADVEELCTLLADRIEGNGSRRPTITKGWRTSARLLLDKDGHTVEQVTRAIEWCQADEFWRANVLSMPTLRKQYDRLRLAAKRDAGPRRPAGARPIITDRSAPEGIIEL